ncbi:MAG: tetratricopeptide repeat protein [Gammaproteobacteria bacterium]
MVNGSTYFVILLFVLFIQFGASNKSSAQQDGLMEATEAGEAHSQFLIGQIFNSGDKPSDKRQAIKWFRKAASQGHVDAMFHLGVMLETGQGTAKDIKEATRWYLAAAKGGNPDAMYTVSKMYGNGAGISKNSLQAHHWYDKAIKEWDSHPKLGEAIGNSILRHDR